MSKLVRIGSKLVGEGQLVFVVAEIGINHNGDIVNVKRLIDAASFAGCDAVKFQKRVPVLAVPTDQKYQQKDTPWGKMTYLDYKERIELDYYDYVEINEYSNHKNIMWFASAWDVDSVDFLEKFNIPCYKVASAGLTNDCLLKRIKQTGKPIILSTGMSTLKQIDHAVKLLGTNDLIIMHCTSTYPANLSEINLNVIPHLKQKYNCPIGYSGHEIGLQVSIAAVALGASVIERHITLDRTMWGTDQSASVEPYGLLRLVRDIHVVSKALGDGNKQVYESELPIMKKLRC